MTPRGRTMGAFADMRAGEDRRRTWGPTWERTRGGHQGGVDLGRTLT